MIHAYSGTRKFTATNDQRGVGGTQVPPTMVIRGGLVNMEASERASLRLGVGVRRSFGANTTLYSPRDASDYPLGPVFKTVRLPDRYNT